MSPPFAIVDLFSGPGGLAEGFAACRGPNNQPFYRSYLSVENDSAAYQTLLLRNFYWQFGGRAPDSYYSFINGEAPEPDWRAEFPNEWQAAERIALCLRLGSSWTTRVLNTRIASIRRAYGDRTVLLGGPPCQAYSLVGRARTAGTPGYGSKSDDRMFLYKQYVKTLFRLKPAAFVMENVTGLLSATLDGRRIFPKILRALRGGGRSGTYRLLAVSSSHDVELLDGMASTPSFVVRSENHGVPQARHRVFVVGIRADLADIALRAVAPRLNDRTCTVPVRAVLGAMPRLRSGLSRGDAPDVWKRQFLRACSLVSLGVKLPSKAASSGFKTAVARARRQATSSSLLPRTGSGSTRLPQACPQDLAAWLQDSNLCTLPNNETRGHMPADLARYLFAAVFAEACGYSPKANDFPARLAPSHRNWRSGHFNDRFRVQLFDRPATTITSHISKDGHYYIHPDPSQCRSLTVREAARLQTFPDNYYFCGTRTEQYVQVGNAVPPFLALQIAQALVPALVLMVESNQSVLPTRDVAASL